MSTVVSAARRAANALNEIKDTPGARNALTYRQLSRISDMAVWLDVLVAELDKAVR